MSYSEVHLLHIFKKYFAQFLRLLRTFFGLLFTLISFHIMRRYCFNPKAYLNILKKGSKKKHSNPKVAIT